MPFGLCALDDHVRWVEVVVFVEWGGFVDGNVDLLCWAVVFDALRLCGCGSSVL